MGSTANKIKVSILYSDYEDIGSEAKFLMKELLEMVAAAETEAVVDSVFNKCHFLTNQVCVLVCVVKIVHNAILLLF
jgi:hypothetical protein